MTSMAWIQQKVDIRVRAYDWSSASASVSNEREARHTPIE